MPALTIPSPTTTHPATHTDASGSTVQHIPTHSEPNLPHRPPVEPLSPIVPAAQLAPVDTGPTTRTHGPPPEHATFMRQPSPLSISESDNPDAIALRSAISLLQLQREKSKRDIKQLQELKSAAVADPQGFAKSLHAQRMNAPHTTSDPLGPTLADMSESRAVDSDGSDTESRNSAVRKDSAETETRFAPIPQAQNIIRCPPVNWAKYHIVGEPLDKMHEEQRRYPGSVEPPRTQQGTKAPPHAVSAPYSPFTDGVSDTRRSSKKSPS